MNYGIIENLLSDYGFIPIVIASVISVIELLIERLLKEKLPKKVFGIVNAVSGILCGIAYDSVYIQGRFSVRSESLTLGVVIFSVSTVIKVIIGKLSRGENVSDDLILNLIEGIIEGIVDGESLPLLAEKISLLFSEDSDERSIREKISEILKSGSTLSESEIVPTTGLIIESVQRLKKENAYFFNAQSR